MNISVTHRTRAAFHSTLFICARLNRSHPRSHFIFKLFYVVMVVSVRFGTVNAYAYFNHFSGSFLYQTEFRCCNRY